MFIDQDTSLRVDIQRPYKGFSRLDTPEIRAMANVVEIPDPQLPEGEKEEEYYRTEQNDAPYVVFTKKSPEQIRQEFLNRLPVLSPWQMRKALNAANLRTVVEGAVAASTDQEVKDAWDHAQEFRRDNPLVIAIATAMGKTEEDLDNLWILGGTL